jgi:glutathione S-transferase
MRAYALHMAEAPTVPDRPIVLYGDRMWDSPYFFSAFVALKEKALPFEVGTLDIDHGEQHAARFRDRTLTARIPAIDHDGFVLSESLAIIEYLDECFPAPGWRPLLPATTVQRARARQLLGWLRSDLLALRDERPTTTMFFERATAPLTEKGRAAADKLIRVANQVVPQGEGDLFGAWSSADADLAFMLHRLIMNDDDLPERLVRYAARQWSRPSVRAFIEHDRPDRASS